MPRRFSHVINSQPLSAVSRPLLLEDFAAPVRQLCPFERAEVQQCVGKLRPFVGVQLLRPFASACSVVARKCIGREGAKSGEAHGRFLG